VLHRQAPDRGRARLVCAATPGADGRASTGGRFSSIRSCRPRREPRAVRGAEIRRGAGEGHLCARSRSWSRIRIAFAFDRIARQPNTLAVHSLIALAGAQGVQTDGLQDGSRKRSCALLSRWRRFDQNGKPACDRRRRGPGPDPRRAMLADPQSRQVVEQEDRRARSIGVKACRFSSSTANWPCPARRGPKPCSTPCTRPKPAPRRGARFVEFAIRWIACRCKQPRSNGIRVRARARSPRAAARDPGRSPVRCRQPRPLFHRCVHLPDRARRGGAAADRRRCPHRHPDRRR